jgi:hypothetical protein
MTAAAENSITDSSQVLIDSTNQSKLLIRILLSPENDRSVSPVEKKGRLGELTMERQHCCTMVYQRA